MSRVRDWTPALHQTVTKDKTKSPMPGSSPSGRADRFNLLCPPCVLAPAQQRLGRPDPSLLLSQSYNLATGGVL